MITGAKGQKLTCKGDIGPKLATVGIDSDTLYPFQFQFEGGDIDIADSVTDIADSVMTALTAAYPSEVIDDDSINGEGFCNNWHALIVAEVTKLVTSTAIQGRAYKATLIANTEGCTEDHFSATPKSGNKAVSTGPDALALLMGQG
jgi:hypothetical protein